jgi:hypothetical protein
VARGSVAVAEVVLSGHINLLGSSTGTERLLSQEALGGDPIFAGETGRE